jgi:transposase
MEDVLDVYQRPPDPKRPVVCVDEKSKQLVDDVREPLPPKPGTVDPEGRLDRPGKPARQDYEYKRHGTANLFVAFEPLSNWRRIDVTERRTKIDFAHFIKSLIDERYREAEKVLLVMDNLNTHSPASLYEAFVPEEAKRLADKLEIHYTPKHGSWLNMAEIELNAVSRRLEDRVESSDALRHATDTITVDRNARACTAHWQFKTADARIKLQQLYPKIER